MAETVKGLNIKLGLDAAELNESLSRLKSELKEQQADLRAINQGLRYDPDNVDLWRQKQAKLNEVLATTRERLRLQNQQLEETRKAVEIGAMGESEFKRLERSVQYAEADVAKLNSELGKTEDQIKRVSDAKWDRLAGFGSAVTKYVTVPVTAAVTALAAMAKASINSADEIGDAASKVYLSAEAYQEWAYAAEMLAVDQAQMQKAFVRVNAILGDIAGGSADEVNEKLRLIGLTSEDLAGLTTDQAFTKIRDALSELGDEATRTAVANEIFGDKLGSELAQLLSASSEQVSSLREECEELGVVSTEDAEAAGAFNDSVQRLSQSLASLKNELVQALLPALNSLVDLLTNKIVPAAKRVLEWWNGLSDGAKSLAIGLAAVATAAGPVLVAIGKLIPLLSSLKAAIVAVQAASNASGGWVTLIAILAVLLLQNERFRELLMEIVEILGGAVGRLMESLQGVIEAIVPVLESVLGLLGGLIDALVSLIEKVLPPLQGIIDAIVGLVEKLAPLIKRIVGALGDLIARAIDLIVEILDPIIEVVEVILDLVVDLVDEALGLIESVLDPIMGILDVIVDLVEVVVDVLGSLISTLANILRPILRIVVQLLQPIVKVLEVIISAIGALFDVLGPLISDLLKPLEIILGAIGEVLTVISPLLELLGGILEAVLVPVLELVTNLLSPILELLDWIISGIQWLADNLGGLLEGWGEGISGFADGFMGALGGAVDWVTDKFSGFFNWLSEGFSGIVDWLGGIGQGISDGWNAFTGWLGDVGNGIGNWFSDTFNVGSAQPAQAISNSSTTTNNVTINTSSAEFDVDSINRALGGSYI